MVPPLPSPRLAGRQPLLASMVRSIAKERVKRAILVGIDEYPTVGSLTGCVADATALAELLSRHADGDRNWDTRLMTSEGGPSAVRGMFFGAHLLSCSRTPATPAFSSSSLVMARRPPWGADLVT